MTGMKKKKLISNFITYGIVIIAFIIVQIMQSTGNLSSMMTGLLVPLCVYVVLAVSLNLVVGISGELSLGHAGFMCIGAFAGAFFSKCTQNTITVGGLRFFLALLIGAAFAALFGLLIGIPVLHEFRLTHYITKVPSAIHVILYHYGNLLSCIFFVILLQVL